MKRLFTKGLDPNQPTKMTEIGEIPEHWLIQKLGDLFEVQQGKQFSRKHHASKVYRYVPFLRTSHVEWGKIIIPPSNTNDLMPISSEKELRKFQVKRGDIFICEGGDVGRTGILRVNVNFELIYQNHLHRLRPTSSKIVPDFFVYWMEYAIRYNGLYISVANRTTIPNLSSSRLKEFLIPVPPPWKNNTKLPIFS